MGMEFQRHDHNDTITKELD